MKLWAGRFQKETDALVNDFNSSISFDARMYREDITGLHRPRGHAGQAGDHQGARGREDHRRPQGHPGRH